MDICKRAVVAMSKQMVRPWPSARVWIVTLCIVINEDQRIKGHIMGGVSLRINVSRAECVRMV